MSRPEPSPTRAGTLRLARPDDAVFRQVRSGNAFEETVERILQAIKLGVVPPGSRLPPQRALAGRLGISRATLREALRALEHAGYVESRRGRFGGTFVLRSAVGPAAGDARRIARGMGDRLRDALTFRDVVEPGAAELAAGRGLDRAAQDYLRRLLAETSAAPVTGYRPADSRLHLAIAELAGSPSLASAIADVRMRLNDLLDAIPLLERNLAHSNDQHGAVVTAILAGDRATARLAMQEHLAATAALLRGFLG